MHGSSSKTYALFRLQHLTLLCDLNFIQNEWQYSITVVVYYGKLSQS